MTTNIKGPVYLETERQKSRDYKRFYDERRKTAFAMALHDRLIERRKTALAMALHDRLGEDSAIAGLGGDILSLLIA